MIKRTPDELLRGDTIRFREDGKDYPLMDSRASGSDPDLWCLAFSHRPDITMPVTSQLFVTQMLRPFVIDCLLCEAPQKFIRNVANSELPGDVLCKDCHESAADRLAKWAAEVRAQEGIA